MTPAVVCHSFTLPVTVYRSDRRRVVYFIAIARRLYCTVVTEVLLRSLYGATALMAVPRRPHCGLAQPAVTLRKFWTCSKFPLCHREGPWFWQFCAVLRRSMAKPLRHHGDHGGGTAVYAVQAPQWHGASGGAVPLRCLYTEARRNMFKVSAVPPRSSAVLIVFRGATAINDGTTAEPKRSWRCHCGLLCRTSTAVAPRLRCDGVLMLLVLCKSNLNTLAVIRVVCLETRRPIERAKCTGQNEALTRSSPAPRTR